MCDERWELVENPCRYDDYHWYSDHVPARRFYGFLAEIGRRLRHLMNDPGPIAMIELCQQCADGQLPEVELSDLADRHRPASDAETYLTNVANELYWWVADRYKVSSRSFSYAVGIFAAQAAVDAGVLSPNARWHEDVQAALEQPRFAEISLRTALDWGDVVRDIYGPSPFETKELDASWRTPAVSALLAQVVGQQDVRAMPILADALEDSGCDNIDLLAHLREPGSHVRGCWAVDLMLGR